MRIVRYQCEIIGVEMESIGIDRLLSCSLTNDLRRGSINTIQTVFSVNFLIGATSSPEHETTISDDVSGTKIGIVEKRASTIQHDVTTRPSRPMGWT